MGVCDPCEADGGSLFVLRRREGNQSPLSLRLRRPQPRVRSVLPLLERGMWNSPGEPRVTLRNTSTASKRHSCAMPRRFSSTIFKTHRSGAAISLQDGTTIRLKDWTYFLGEIVDL